MENGKRKDKDKERNLGNRALLEVDQRIATALVERDEASRKVSLLVYWQDRLSRLNQDIDMLISIQQRLSGKPQAPSEYHPPTELVHTLPPPLAIPYSHTAVIPNNVSSVPRQPNPQPSGANVASDVESEGGFA